MRAWVIIALMLALAGSLYGVGKWQRQDGFNESENVWLAKEKKELEAANKKIVELEAKLRTAEAAKEKVVINAITEQEKQRDEIKKDTEKRIADLRARLLRMRDPGVRPSQNGGDAPAGITSAASAGNETSGGELSRAASEFLLRLTAEADEAVVQLTTCQKILVADRIPVE